MAARDLVPGQSYKFSFTPFEIRFLSSLIGMPPNNVYFVSSTATNAADATDAGTRAHPFATIDYAVGRCTASVGDVIIALPGHVETISAAGSLTMDVAGVTLVGLGVGYNRPRLNYTATAGTVEMDADNTRISNCIFSADISAVAVGVNIDGNYCEIDNCFVTMIDTGDDFVIWADATSVSHAYIHDNHITTEASVAGADSGVRLQASTRARIHDNVFKGQWAKAPIIVETTLSAEVSILRNVIYNTDTSVYNGIDTGTLSSTGIVAWNAVTALYATAVAKIYRDGDLTTHDNSWCNAVSVRGTTLLPATSAS